MKSIIKSIAIVILNYMSCQETVEYIDSIGKFYPDIPRIIIVDNGTPEKKLNFLKIIVNKNSRISLHEIGENLGFAKGNNIGIKIALSEGYKYIVCSNNDILFTEGNVLEKLYYDLIKYNAAVVGPSIINLKGQNQNPLLIERPNKKQFKRIAKGHSLFRILGAQLIKKPEMRKRIKDILRLKTNIDSHDAKNTSSYVYALHGSFLMFGPLFLKHYDGFDPSTFLYGEELILGEMLLKKELKAYYDSEVCILHKEDKTSDIVWGGQDKLKPRLFARESFRVYKKWWKNNNRILEERNDES